MPRSFRRVVPALLVLPLLTASAPAGAQEAPPPNVERRNGWVSAGAGVSIGSETRTGPLFVAEYGDDVHRRVQATVTIAYHENMLHRRVEDDLALLSTSLTSVTGTPWSLRGRDRAVTFVAAGRYLFADEGTMRPYAGAGAGVINLRRTVVDPRAGDVTSAVFREYGIGEAALTTLAATRPLVEAALGVGFYSGPVYVDVGYRYNRAFHLNETYDYSQLVFGLGYKF